MTGVQTCALPIFQGPIEEITPTAPLSPMSEPASVDDVTMDTLALPSNDSNSNQHIDNVSSDIFKLG